MIYDGGLRRFRVRVLGLFVALTVVAVGVPPAPANADYVALCNGYAGCASAGYPNSGYRVASGTSYWRMYTGHNCTNYAAYRMVKAGLPNTRPWPGDGNAENWGHAMASITNGTPTVGAVAWWDAYVNPAGGAGHVAYVERVVSSSEIWISEDSWNGDFHWRRVTRSGSGWPSGFIHFHDVALLSTTAPAVSGTAQVGQTLTATPGTWSRPATTYTYQWLADGVPISGATAPTYVPGSGKLGMQISVAVSAGATGYAPGTATSAATSAVTPGELTSVEKPVITGEALVGSVLTASTGSWSPAEWRRTVQWLSDGNPIDGATGWTLTLGQEQAGTVITAVVTATRTGYTPSAVTTDPTASVLGGTVQVTAPFELTGVPRLGRQLTVVNGSFDPSTATVAYTWLRDGTSIAGAGAPTYVPTDADVGAHIAVRVRLAKPGFKAAYQRTAATSGVHSIPQLQVTAQGGAGRAQVAVTVTAPGVDLPGGLITVRIGTVMRTVHLFQGQRTVQLLHVRAGLRRVVVHYLGRGLVDRGTYRGDVSIQKP